MLSYAQLGSLLKPRGRTRRVRLGRIFGRLFWLSMAIAHGPAFWDALSNSFRSGYTLEHIVSFVLLAASMLFFVLKVGGFRFVRVFSDRRTIMVFCIIVGLLHVDLTGAADGPQWLYPPIIASSLLAIPLLKTRKLRGKSDPRGDDDEESLFRRLCSFHSTDWKDTFAIHNWLLKGHSLGLRAPPV